MAKQAFSSQAGPQLTPLTLVLSTGMTPKTTGAWLQLDRPYRLFGMRCVAGSAVGTSNFSVKLQGVLSTQKTTGAAVGAIGAYVPTALISYSQANIGQLKASTALLPANVIRFSSTTFTTAATRSLRIEVV